MTGIQILFYVMSWIWSVYNLPMTNTYQCHQDLVINRNKLYIWRLANITFAVTNKLPIHVIAEKNEMTDYRDSLLVIWKGTHT